MTPVQNKVNVLCFLVMIALVACPKDMEVQTAKLALGFVTLGMDTAKNIIDKVAESNKNECMATACLALGNTPKGSAKFDACMKTDQAKNPVFMDCFKETAKMLKNSDLLVDQMNQLLRVVTASINAYQQKKDGAAIDLFTPIKEGVCLLTKLSRWIPVKMRSKVDYWIALAGSYSCTELPTSTLDFRDHMLLVRLRRLLLEMGARA